MISRYNNVGSLDQLTVASYCDTTGHDDGNNGMAHTNHSLHNLRGMCHQVTIKIDCSELANGRVLRAECSRYETRSVVGRAYVLRNRYSAC